MKKASPSAGFTMIELAIVIAIFAGLGAITYASMERQRPRAQLANSAAELHSLLHGARQQALATGHPVAVMFFPDYSTGDGLGRVIVYEDGLFDFFTTGTVNFDGYDPSRPAAPPLSQVVSTFDLPRGILVGPTTGMGADTTLPAPWDGIDVSTACSFCSTSSSRRGAVVFDGRGRASFYSRNGTPLAVTKGGSVTVQAPELGAASRTFVITTSTGAVRAYNNG